MRYDNVHRYIRWALVLLSIVFFLWVTNQQVPFGGVKKISYTFGRPDGTVTLLHPRARVVPLSGTGPKSVGERILEDPVYFELKTRVPYDRLTLVVRYRLDDVEQMKVGVKTGRGAFAYTLFPLNTTRDKGEWRVGRVQFSLSGAVREGNRYGFLFSIPGLNFRARDQSQGVVVQDLSLELVRPTLHESVIHVIKKML